MSDETVEAEIEMVEAIVTDDLINGQVRLIASDKPQLVPADLVEKHPSKFESPSEAGSDDGGDASGDDPAEPSADETGADAEGSGEEE